MSLISFFGGCACWATKFEPTCWNDHEGTANVVCLSTIMEAKGTNSPFHIFSFVANGTFAPTGSPTLDNWWPKVPPLWMPSNPETGTPTVSPFSDPPGWGRNRAVPVCELISVRIFWSCEHWTLKEPPPLALGWVPSALPCISWLETITCPPVGNASWPVTIWFCDKITGSPVAGWATPLAAWFGGTGARSGFVGLVTSFAVCPFCRLLALPFPLFEVDPDLRFGMIAERKLGTLILIHRLPDISHVNP